jgi:hypothetical protein
MANVVVGLVVVGTVVAVMIALALVAVRVRRRGTAGPAIGAAMAAYDEAMNSNAHNTFVEVQAQRDHTVPVESRDDT